jgi:hypothetical protein
MQVVAPASEVDTNEHAVVGVPAVAALKLYVLLTNNVMATHKPDRLAHLAVAPHDLFERVTLRGGLGGLAVGAALEG